MGHTHIPPPHPPAQSGLPGRRRAPRQPGGWPWLRCRGRRRGEEGAPAGGQPWGAAAAAQGRERRKETLNCWYHVRECNSCVWRVGIWLTVHGPLYGLYTQAIWATHIYTNKTSWHWDKKQNSYLGVFILNLTTCTRRHFKYGFFVRRNRSIVILR
jgi:hypothetical protein